MVVASQAIILPGDRVAVAVEYRKYDPTGPCWREIHAYTVCEVLITRLCGFRVSLLPYASSRVSYSERITETLGRSCCSSTVKCGLVSGCGVLEKHYLKACLPNVVGSQTWVFLSLATRDLSTHASCQGTSCSLLLRRGGLLPAQGITGTFVQD